MTGDAKQAMADADAAMRQREYEKAVKTMLAIQQAQLNAQQAEAARQIVTLPPPRERGPLSVEEALRSRRSVRTFAGGPLTLVEVSQLLWAAQGITSAALATGVPMAFGVLTTNSVEEALERSAAGPANKGREAALAALEMATLVRGLREPA